MNRIQHFPKVSNITNYLCVTIYELYFLNILIWNMRNANQQCACVKYFLNILIWNVRNEDQKTFLSMSLRSTMCLCETNCYSQAYVNYISQSIYSNFPVNVSPVNKLLVHSSTSFSNVAARWKNWSLFSNYDVGKITAMRASMTSYCFGGSNVAAR